jgi:hypothetical protein
MLTAVGVLALMVLLPALAAAWPSLPADSSIHRRIAEDAINDLLGQDRSKYGELDTYRAQLLSESNYEDSHGRKRDPDKTLADYTYWWEMAVGNNPGTNHPEYWWQTALHYYREGKKPEAYTYLGRLIHLVEDQGVPAHAYYIMHGLEIGLDKFETLAFGVGLGNYYPDYYKKPDSTSQPGKNILDAGSHGDDDYLTCALVTRQNNWTHCFDTNLQVPGARKVKVYTYNPPGWPVFYLKFEYQALRDGTYQWVTHESGKMCAAYTCGEWVGFPPEWRSIPRTHEWEDTFAPNTTLRVSYKRPESGTDRDVQFKIYVEETADVRNEIQDPRYVNPWEYYDWLREWTLWATQAPYWRRYYLDGKYQDNNGLGFDVTWTTAPNTERALLSVQERVTREAIKWALEAAVDQFQQASSVTDQAALGKGYRMVLYDDWKYNSTGGSPEYIKSLPLVCEPHPGCGVLTINDLGWMGGRISSLEVRGAQVTLYSGKNLTGDSLVVTADTSYVGSAFNDRALSLKIEPIPATPALANEATVPVHVVGSVESSPWSKEMLDGDTFWAGADTRPQKPRILEGVLQFDLASTLPTDATIVGAQLELTGGSAEFLTPGAGGEWWVDLLDAAADEDWPDQVTYGRIHSALVDLTLEPRLGEADLAEGQGYTFPIDEYHAQWLTWRLGTDGQASFRVSSSQPARPMRHVFGFKARGDGAPVLRVWYTMP